LPEYGIDVRYLRQRSHSRDNCEQVVAKQAVAQQKKKTL
jgi:hypothetical protein